MEILDARLSEIHASPTNPRKSFPAEEMAEMIESVRTHGIIQPILVRPWPMAYAYEGDTAPTYELIAGERRYRAAKGAGLERIPVMVRHLSDKEVLEIQIIENLQRKGLNELEEAEGYDLMIRQHGYTADQLAEKINKSRAYIYGRLKLLALSMPGRLAFRDGRLTASTALLIARIPGEALQAKAIDEITQGYHGVLSYRDAATVIQRDYCCYLDKAPFPQENLLLVASAGGCAACPKRSGSAPDLFPDIARPDVCTDPACYKAKTGAWLAYQKAQAEEAGKTVIAGEAAEKIDIAYKRDKYEMLDSYNYQLENSPSYRDLVKTMPGVEVVLIEDTRSGKLVEAVEKKALASALEAAGVVAQVATGRERELEIERKVRAENVFRQRLFAERHHKTRAQLADEETPHPSTEDLAMIAGTLWHALWSESQEVVVQLWSAESKRETHWDRRTERVREVSEKIQKMARADLILFLLDCSLAGESRASANNFDVYPWRLTAEAVSVGVDLEQIRADIEAGKSKKGGKSTAENAPPPTKAPLGAGSVRNEKKAPVVGDWIEVIKAAIPAIKVGDRGVIGGSIGDGERFRISIGNRAFYLKPTEFSVIPAPSETTSTPTEAALAGGNQDADADGKGLVERDANPSGTSRRPVEFAHPDDASLCWSGRGRKPAWVLAWIADGGSLDQLRVAGDEKTLSSDPDGSNATPSSATTDRCNDTLELPLD